MKRQLTAPAATGAGPVAGNPRRASSSFIGGYSVPPPMMHLGPHIRDDMTDEELCVVIESLVTRIENSMSTLVSGSSSY